MVKELPTPVMEMFCPVVYKVPRLVKFPPPAVTLTLLSEVMVTAPSLLAELSPMLTLPPLVLMLSGDPPTIDSVELTRARVVGLVPVE